MWTGVQRGPGPISAPKKISTGDVQQLKGELWLAGWPWKEPHGMEGLLGPSLLLGSSLLSKPALCPASCVSGRPCALVPLSRAPPQAREKPSPPQLPPPLSSRSLPSSLKCNIPSCTERVCKGSDNNFRQ